MKNLDQKLLRLEKRHKGLARVTAAINDLYIYGIYEQNFPALMIFIYMEFMKVITQL